MGKMDKYRILRNKVSKLINLAKKETYQTKTEQCNDELSIWKIFRELVLTVKIKQKIRVIELA